MHGKKLGMCVVMLVLCGIRLSEPQCQMHNHEEEMCFIIQVKVIVHIFPRLSETT
jgi:hypothetical protein